MILTAIVIGGLCAAYVCAALLLMVLRGLAFRQALLYVPFKVAFRIDDASMKAVRRGEAPVIYVVTHRSRIDPALMLALLPEDTLHILDEGSAKSAWLEPWRDLARTITFNAKHVFVSRRLVVVLKRKGRIAVYIPENVEPDTRAFRLYRAVSRIALQADARVVPIFVGGAHRLPTALAPGGATRRRWFPKLRIGALPGRTITELVVASVGSSTTGSNALFDRVAEARAGTRLAGTTLFHGMREAASRFGPDSVAIEDMITGPMSYRQLLIGARIFAGRFARSTAPGEAVGILLPNSNGLVLTLLALWSAGRTATPLNHTAGTAAITAAMRMVPLRLVVSSRAYVDKADLGATVTAAEAGGARFVWIEDLRDGIVGFDRLVAALWWRGPVGRQDAEAPAVILFSSGSEGAPKAVVLSHRNLVANAMQVEARLAVGPGDRVLAVLPAFHALGLIGGVVLPLLVGVPSLLYPTPLHFRQIPKLAGKSKPTVLFATDTFLAAYAKAAEDADFASLRLVVAGAEPLRPATRQVWRERFGIDPLEGYGLTEASPVVALNTAAHGREGTVGRLLPGLRGRLEPVDGIADGGRLWIRGPNVMMGYIFAERPGVLVPVPDDWHDTGDVISADREGFLTVRGRVKRFAKIAGEMVSLAGVEALAAQLWPEERHAATAVPDSRRGERIVLVTTAAGAELSEFRQHARRAGAPDIALPDAILHVDEIPLLGSGKIDHAAVRRLAENQPPPVAAVA